MSLTPAYTERLGVPLRWWVQGTMLVAMLWLAVAVAAPVVVAWLVTAVDLTLRPGERALVPTGIAMAVPDGYVALVHPRSGLAARHGLSIVNTPGTIDAGYRGEVKVLLVNHDPREPIELRRGDRVAQLVFQRVEQAAFAEVEVLPQSVRGGGGYGSTGGFGGSATGPAPDTAGSERT